MNILVQSASGDSIILMICISEQKNLNTARTVVLKWTRRINMKICSRCNKIIGLYTPYKEISDNEILCSKCANKWLYEKLKEAFENLPGWKSSKENK